MPRRRPHPVSGRVGGAGESKGRGGSREPSLAAADCPRSAVPPAGAHRTPLPPSNRCVHPPSALLSSGQPQRDPRVRRVGGRQGAAILPQHRGQDCSVCRQGEPPGAAGLCMPRGDVLASVSVLSEGLGMCMQGMYERQGCDCPQINSLSSLPPPPPHHHHHHTPLAVPPRSFWSQRGAPPPRCTCKASPLGCPSGCSWRCCTACRGSRAARCCGRRTQVRGIPSSRCQHQAWRRRRRRRKGKERKGTDGAVEIWAAASTGPPLPCSRVPFAPDLPPTAPRCTPLLNSAYQLLPAVEYDYLPAHQCHATLETKKVSGLFFSGQLNGTTGES